MNHLDNADIARWREGNRRLRLLTGQWEQDVMERLAAYLDPSRLANMGRPILSVNLFKSVVSQLAVLYDEAPKIVTDSPDDEILQDILIECRLSNILAQNCLYTIGLRESLIKIEWAYPGKPRLRLVPSASVVLETAPDDCFTPIKIKELRTREILGKQVECWDVWDLSGPSFRVESKDGEDLTTEALGEPVEWVWLDPEGRPFLPWVVYRAQATGQVWNWEAFGELVQATLDLSVFWSMWGHLLRDASWPQKWGLDVTLPGVSVRGSGASQAGEVSTSPTSILMFQAEEGGGSLGQFSPGGNPAEMGEAIRAFQATVLTNLGIHPADLVQSSGESGYAIQLKRSAQRREAAKLIPIFRDSDKDLINKIVHVVNLFSSTLAIDPPKQISISYGLVKEDPREAKEELEYLLGLVAQNIISQADLLRSYHPDLSHDQALVKLAENQAINKGDIGAIAIPAKRAGEIAKSLAKEASISVDKEDPTNKTEA